MRLLLDTHAFLWFISADDRLSDAAARQIEATGNELSLSIASALEMAIKVSIGKLRLRAPLDGFFSTQTTLNGVQIIGLDFSHLQLVSQLPFHHRDPFDRLLVAQAMWRA